MLKNNLLTLLLLSIVLTISGLSSKAYAQDPQFSQFYANPIYLNPAFAGSHGVHDLLLTTEINGLHYQELS